MNIRLGGRALSLLTGLAAGLALMGGIAYANLSQPGPQGPQGLQGPAGAAQIGGVTGWGFARDFAVIPEELGFISPTVEVTVDAGQVVFIEAGGTFGSTGGASNLDLQICSDDPTAGLLILADNGPIGLQVPAGLRVPVSFSKATTLNHGTWKIGLCGSARLQSANWNDNFVAYVSVLVFDE